MKIKAVIFDIGATLVTGPPVAPNKVIAALLNGVPASDVSSVIMTNDLTSSQAVCSALESRFGKLSSEAVAKITDLWNSQATAPVEIDGASDTVLALKHRGFKIGLLSDIWNPYYAGVERALPGVVKSADSIILSCKTGSKKPNTANFISALSDLGISPSEAVMVGDTYTHDIYPALQIGMSAVWVLARPDREAESVIDILNGKLPAPTATVSNISEVKSLELLTTFEG